MMGQLRTAVQTMAAMETPPAQLLRNLDDLARRLGDTYLATCPVRGVRPDPRRPDPRQRRPHPHPCWSAPRTAAANSWSCPPARRSVSAASRSRPSGSRSGPVTAWCACTDGLVEVRGSDIGEGWPRLRIRRPPRGLHGRCLRHHHPRPQHPRRTQGRRRPAHGPPQRHPRRPRRRIGARPRPARGGPGPPPGPRAPPGLGSAAGRRDGRTAGQRGRHQRRPACRERPDRPADRPHRRAAVRGHRRRTGPARHAERPAPTTTRAAACAVVSRLAREWGASATGHRKTVWFEQALGASG